MAIVKPSWLKVKAPLSKEYDEILQFSIVDLYKGVVFNEYIKPRKCKSWKDTEAIHHITPEMVKDCFTINAHQATTPSSSKRYNALTVADAFGLNNVSSVPSVFSLAILFLVTPHTVTNAHQITILPVDCSTIAFTAAEAFGLNIVSKLPSVFNLAIKFLATHHIVVNDHQAITFPSD